MSLLGQEIQRSYRQACAEYQEFKQEGWRRFVQRTIVERKILDTPPMYTTEYGPVEVRVLAGRRNWMNVIWALKSFYFFARADLPLYIHDGGLKPWQASQLQDHFPSAILIGAKDSDDFMARALGSRWLYKSIQCRRREVATRRVFDFFAMSKAEQILSIDSSLIFFQQPVELLSAIGSGSANLFTEDRGPWYGLPASDLAECFGIEDYPKINAGLSLIRRESIDFEFIEQCLRNANGLSRHRIDDHTLHVIASARAGASLLPRVYSVGVTLQWDSYLISKQYPAQARALLDEEGYDRLLRVGFPYELRRAALIASGMPGEPRSSNLLTTHLPK